MWFKVSKYYKEIKALSGLNKDSGLSLLRQQALKEQLFSKIDSLNQTNQAPSIFKWTIKKHSFAYLVVPVVLVIFVSSTIFASAQALPGEPLYAVKKLKEQVETAVAISQTSQAKVEAKHAQVRLEELVKVTAKVEAVEQEQKTATTEAKKLEVTVTNDTQVQVEKALNELVKVENKLQTQGQKQAASKIKERISELSQQANETKFEVVKIKNGRDRFEVKIKAKNERRNNKSDSDDNDDDENRDSNNRRDRDNISNNEDSNDNDSDRNSNGGSENDRQGDSDSKDSSNNASSEQSQEDNTSETNTETEVELDLKTPGMFNNFDSFKWRNDD